MSDITVVKMALVFMYLLYLGLQGNARQKKTLPEKDSFYRTAVPHTAAKHIGSQLSSTHSKDMLRLEMTTCHTKKKTDLERYYS